MKPLIAICLVGSIMTCLVEAQQAPEPALRKGVPVQMPIANNAVEMRAADEPNATVVAITASGKVFAGIQPTEPGALSQLGAETIYVKADARVPFQTVLAVLGALRGKSVVILAASPIPENSARVRSPFGIRLIVPR